MIGNLFFSDSSVPISPQHQREIACLLCGGLLGAGISWSLRPAVTSATIAKAAPAPPLVTARAQIGQEASSDIDDGWSTELARRPVKNDDARNLRNAAVGLRRPDQTSDEIRDLLQPLDSKALGRLMADVSSWPPTNRNRWILEKIIRRWAEIDPIPALTEGQALALPGDNRLYRGAMDSFIANDPAKACEYLAAVLADPTNESTRMNWTSSDLRGALDEWARQDPPAAASFIASHSLPDDVTFSAAEVVGQGLAQSDVPTALAWSSQLKGDTVADRVRSGILKAWVAQDRPAALQYARTLPDNYSNKKLIEEITGDWAMQSPQEVIRWSSQSPFLRTATAFNVVDGWIKQDPYATAAWAASLPSGDFRSDDTRRNVYREIAERWSKVDPAAAEQWIIGLPEGWERDFALMGHGTRLSENGDYAKALDWAARIRDKSVREDKQVEALGPWFQKDAQAAQKWMSQSNLPTAVTDRFQSQ